MGEEADLIHFDDDDGNGYAYGVSVLEWEVGLPTADELTPLSQPLVPPELASAFGIRPEPAATILDVHRASQATLSSILNASGGAEDPSPDNDSNPPPPPPPPPEEEEEERSARALKRQRLVWTPQLHRRFVEVVAHLGIKNAVPKTIMQLMNVEGLTRENVASHLQKYRLYLKRMSGLSNEGPSASDPIFASTPVPEDLMTAQQLVQPMSMMQGKHVPVPMPYAVPTMIPMHMPVYGMHHYGYDGNYHHQQHAFGGYGEQRGKDWASGSKFGNGSVVSCPHPHRVISNDK